jgi:hypothetical protein
MTSYINQTIARQHIAEMIAHAEAGRVRRQFRQARREANGAARESGGGAASGRRPRRDPWMLYLIPAAR